MITRPDCKLKYCLIGLLFILSVSGQATNQEKKEWIITPEPGTLMTQTIQRTIDSCALAGGGKVIFSEGTFCSGGLELHSHVTLQFEKGAVLQGSKNYKDYLNDAFIFGTNLTNIAITGEGTIDGVNCFNPGGEEGFRGPHCIRLIHCDNITFKGFTVENSANWAFNLRHCSSGNAENIIIRGGHDGFHTRFCNNFTFSGCDVRTGDDAFAGNDNRDFIITGCKINTSCNGFRMGCLNLTVKNCHLWGPGEFIHKIQKRNNMLAAFVHFSPKDENPQLESGNWIIEDITVKNVDCFYVYNFKDGLWQSGKPVTTVKFNQVEAAGILTAFNIIGDEARQFSLAIENSTFSFRQGAEIIPKAFEGAEFGSDAFFNATHFNKIELHQVSFYKNKNYPVLDFKIGNYLIVDQINGLSEGITNPYHIEKVNNIKSDQRIINRKEN